MPKSLRGLATVPAGEFEIVGSAANGIDLSKAVVHQGATGLRPHHGTYALGGIISTDCRTLILNV